MEKGLYAMQRLLLLTPDTIAVVMDGGRSQRS